MLYSSTTQIHFQEKESSYFIPSVYFYLDLIHYKSSVSSYHSAAFSLASNYLHLVNIKLNNIKNHDVICGDLHAI